MIDKSRLWKNVATPDQAASHKEAVNLLRPLYQSLNGQSFTNKEAELGHVRAGLELARSDSFRTIANDREALRVWATREAKQRDLVGVLMSGDPVLADMTVWEGRWAQDGFPTIDVSTPAYAASMCTTTIPTEIVSLVRAPWRTMLIRLPIADLLPISTCDGGIEFVRRILAREHFDDRGARVWTYILEGPSTMISRAEIPTEEMCSIPFAEEFDSPTGAQIYDVDALDRRCLQLASKLVVGTSLSLESDGAFRRFAPNKRMGGGRSGRIPTALRFQVGRPVRIDASQHVRDFIEHGGRRSPVTVQSLVRGHWKNQPHGNDRALRKFIHIEPYWRGPEDAPIAVRPHVLNASEKGAAE